MKKKEFVFFLVIEIIIALIAMGQLFFGIGIWAYFISALVFAAVITPFFIRLKKETDESKKEKIRTYILRVMLIPTAIALLVAILFVIAVVLHLV